MMANKVLNSIHRSSLLVGKCNLPATSRFSLRTNFVLTINTTKNIVRSSSYLAFNRSFENSLRQNYQIGIFRARTSAWLSRLPLYIESRSLVQNYWCRSFQTTARRDINPVFLLLVKPLGKLASVLTGRTLRRWWKKLTPEEKAKYRTRLGERRHFLYAGLGLVGVFALVHYVTHLQVAPITNRRRYISLTDEQALKISMYEYEIQYAAVKDRVLPSNHPAYRRIASVGQRIVNSNQDLEYMRNKKWTVIVVDSDDENAFVLPTGHIFVFTGLLKFADTEQKLAVILGHEISHALLNHAAEHVSFATAIDVVVIIVMAALWTIMPTDGIALVSQWFYEKCVQLMLHLPYSRKLEKEADEVGLQLIAKACYDVRESSAFWSTWALKREVGGDKSVEIPQWLSTHPNNDQRAADLNKLIPEAIKLRETCKCEALPAKDPRESVQYLEQLVNERRKQQEEEKQQQQQQQLQRLTGQ